MGIIIVALMMGGFLWVVYHTRSKELRIKWWQWIITVLGFSYTTFVLMMIKSFLDEGSPRAALVTGVIFGFIAVVWGVLLARFVFSRKSSIKS